MSSEETILVLLEEGFIFSDNLKVFILSLNDDQDQFIASVLKDSKEVILGAKCTKGKDIIFLPYDVPRDEFLPNFRNFMYRSL